MSSGTVNIKLRPLKLAFIVSPNDRSSIDLAIKINSILWGGLYNPIIPFYKRAPQKKGIDSYENMSGKAITEGYIEAYDPDFIVPLGDINLDGYKIPQEVIKEPEKIISSLKEDNSPKYGVGLFELLNYLYDKEIKFIRKFPLEISIPSLSKKHNLFLSSVFGNTSNDIDEIIKQYFDEDLGISRSEVSISNYLENMRPDTLFLRRITAIQINSSRRNSHGDGQTVLLLDSTKNSDVIDYWNLRASGWNILPIDKRLIKQKYTKAALKEFIEENYHPYHTNHKIFHRASIIKGRSIQDKDFDLLVQVLNSSVPRIKNEIKYTVQNWFPRIHHKEYRKYDGVECCRLEVKEEEHDLDNLNQHLTLKLISPSFASKFNFGTPRFANEVDIRTYGDDEDPYVEVFPEFDNNNDLPIFGVLRGEWRISKQGLVYLSSYSSNWRMSLSPPLAETTFISWFKSKGWTVKISGSGLIAKQILKQLGGTWGVAKISSIELINLIDSMKGSRALNKEVFWGKFQRFANIDRPHADPKDLLKSLIESKIFRLGVEMKCTVCQQRSWHSLSDFAYSTKCSICLNETDIPSHSPNEIKWSYRTFGAFSLTNQAFGVYTVLLTYFFFSKTMDGATTPIMSFTAQKDKKEIEADLGLYYQDSSYRNTSKELVFAECKTFNRFDNKDFARMSIISDEFPDAIIVFSCLNSELNNYEVTEITKLVMTNRKRRKEGKIYNPILILTSTELIANISLENTYQLKGGKHKEYINSHGLLREIRPLCDITQELYLGVESWSTFAYGQ